MNNQNDQYRELAGLDIYVTPLKEKLDAQKWDRLMQQVADKAGQSFRPSVPVYSVVKRPNRLIVRRETPAEQSLRQVAYFRGLAYHWYAKQDSRAEPKALDPREYEAQRLCRISRLLATSEQEGEKTKCVPIGKLREVLNDGDRTPATVGTVLGMIDWFRHCLAAFEGRTVAPDVKPIKITPLSPLEQILGDKFTVEHLEACAHAAGLVDKNGKFCAGDKGAFAGFCRALQDKKAGKLKGALGTVVPIVARHFGVDTKVRKTSTEIAERFYMLTNRALKNGIPTD
ncbi:hypothetical protein [Hymenobacter sp. B1770]|uniref:hypothetical protein n=1 Tax=Hymenobacter sp. B1770 TaxID=1718788 RepID=UPI003CECAC2F